MLKKSCYVMSHCKQLSLINFQKFKKSNDSLAIALC
jgi:hypothetical protein